MDTLRGYRDQSDNLHWGTWAVCTSPKLSCFRVRNCCLKSQKIAFWNCIDMFLAQKKNKLQMRPIQKLELPFVSAGLKTLRRKPKQQISLIHGKMQSVRTGTQIPILKLAWAREGINLLFEASRLLHQVPWDDTAGDIITRNHFQANFLFKTSYPRAIFCEAPPLVNSFTFSFHVSPTVSPLQLPHHPESFQLKLWSNGSK